MDEDGTDKNVDMDDGMDDANQGEETEQVVMEAGSSTKDGVEVASRSPTSRRQITKKELEDLRSGRPIDGIYIGRGGGVSPNPLGVTRSGLGLTETGQR